MIGDVIVGIDNAEIHRLKDLFKSLDAHKVGDVVDVTVEDWGNDKQRRKVKVTLQQIP